MTLPSASNPFYRPAAPSRSPAHHTVKPVTIDLTDLSGSEEWSFEAVLSDPDNVVIAISSDSDSSVEAIPLTKDVKARIKKFRKTRPKPDSRTDSEDIPAERFARKVAHKAREFLDTEAGLDNEAGHSGADSGDSAGDGYVSGLIDDATCSSESYAPSPMGHEIPTSKQRNDFARNAAEDAISAIIPALANPRKRSSNVVLTWYDMQTDEVRSKRCRCQDDIEQESDGQERWAYVDDVPQPTPKALKLRRRQDALKKIKNARAASKHKY